MREEIVPGGAESAMPVFAVALPAFRARYKHITAHLASLFGEGVEYVGVNGREADPAHSVAGSGLTPGQIGCALSHVEACRQIVNRSLPNAFVVEDDVILPENIHALLGEVEARIVPGEVVQLYNWVPYRAYFRRAGVTPLSAGALYAPADMRSLGTTGAYVITREAAEGILRVNFPVSVAAENWEFFQSRGAIRSGRALLPSPVRLRDFETTVLPAEAGAGAVARVVWFLKQTVFKPVRTLRRRIRIALRSKKILFADEPASRANL